MKKILLALFIIAGSVSAKAQEIKWLTMDEALAAQKKEAKPIFMDMYTDWCGPCKMLDKVAFHNAEFVDYISKNYYAVKFNAEGNSVVNYKGKKYSNPGFVPDRTGRNAMHEFAGFLQVQGYPSMYVFDSKGEVKSPILGYKEVTELLPLIKI